MAQLLNESSAKPPNAKMVTASWLNHFERGDGPKALDSKTIEWLCEVLGLERGDFQFYQKQKNAGRTLVESGPLKKMEWFQNQVEGGFVVFVRIYSSIWENEHGAEFLKLLYDLIEDRRVKLILLGDVLANPVAHLLESYHSRIMDLSESVEDSELAKDVLFQALLGWPSGQQNLSDKTENFRLLAQNLAEYQYEGETFEKRMSLPLEAILVSSGPKTKKGSAGLLIWKSGEVSTLSKLDALDTFRGFRNSLNERVYIQRNLKEKIERGSP